MVQPALKDKTLQPVSTLQAEAVTVNEQTSQKTEYRSQVLGLTPEKLFSLFRRVDVDQDDTQFLTLIEEMEERDAHYAAVISKRKRSVVGMNYAIVSPSDDYPEDIIDACNFLIAQSDFKTVLQDMSDALAKGYAVIELVWRQINGLFKPDYIRRDQRWFKWNAQGDQLFILLPDATSLGEPLEFSKWVVHVAQLKSGHPIRSGLGRPISLAYIAKAYALDDWSIYAEKFGIPITVVEVPSGADSATRSAALDMAKAIVSDGSAVVDESIVIRFEDARKADSGALYKSICDYYNDEMSKVVLGQTMTTTDGSSRSQSEVHQDVQKHDVIFADAQHLSNTFTAQIIQPFVDLNFGEQLEYPCLTPILDEAEDLAALAAALTPFIDRGLPVQATTILDKFGIEAPEAGADILGSASPITEVGQVENDRMALNQVNSTDELKNLSNELLGEWEPIMEPLMEPIFELAENAKDEASFRKGLRKLRNKLDDEVFVNTMAVQTFKAEGIGDAQDSPFVKDKKGSV